jgi:hypothetical protein
MKNRTPSIVPNQNITYLKPNPEINMVANLIIYFSSKTGLITQRLMNTPRKVSINNLELLKTFLQLCSYSIPKEVIRLPTSNMLFAIYEIFGQTSS